MIQRQTPIIGAEIIGLHGSYNVSLDFEYPVKILVDKNGTGKTTVIYIIVNALQGKWKRVNRYKYESIRLYFIGNESINIESKNFIDNKRSNFWLTEISQKVPGDLAAELLEQISRFPYDRVPNRDLLEFISNELGVDPRRLYRLLSEEMGSRISKRSNQILQLPLFDTENYTIQKQLLDRIQKLFPYKILYFPTYRLVEENLNNLGYAEQKFYSQSEQLIQFGMQGVQKKLERITDDIRKSSVEWFSKINGRMLSQLIDGIQQESIEYESIETPEALRIVLDRIGDNINLENKKHILSLIESGDIKFSKYVPLAYFLSNLVKIYEQQKNNDNAIKDFVRITCSYLDDNDKKIDYDENKLEITLYNKRTKQIMSLDKLSSGEKQIISIFSKLYLDNPEPYAIFFDEPELSLSMEWQRKLLQDITDSEKCAFLMAATHSPFIFENSLARYADVLHINYSEEADEPS